MIKIPGIRKKSPILAARRFAGFDISYYLLPWISSNFDN
jgi:hypothetical protein